MRQLIVSEFVTLDGVMEAPGGEPGHPHTGWVSDIPGEEHFAYKLNEIREAESLLIGRVTYDSFAGAWPEREAAGGLGAAHRMDDAPQPCRCWCRTGRRTSPFGYGARAAPRGRSPTRWPWPSWPRSR